MKSRSILRLAVLAGALTLPGLGRAGSITNDMIVHLPFDADYANLAPSAVTAAPAGAPTIEAGRIGAGAVHISNSRDGSFFNYVTLGAAPELNLGGTVDFTVSFWTKVNSKNGDPSFLSNKDWRSGGNAGWVIFASGGGNLAWNYTESGSSRVDVGSSYTLIDGNWHHVAVSFDRDGNALTYYDGVLSSVTFIGPATETLDSGLPTNIGQDGTGAYTDGGSVEIDALIDDVAIWRRPLTGFELRRIHQFGLSGVGASAVPDPAVVTLADTIPAANAVDVRADTTVTAIIVDGALPLDNGTVQLTLNGSPAAVTFSKVGNATTVTHQPAAPLPNGSTQNARIIFGDGVNSVTSSWSFVVVRIAQPRGITGHWNFDNNDLSASIGQALEYRGGPAGATAAGTAFGTTASFGIPNIQGVPARVMSCPAASTRDIGYLMTHGARPNGDPNATKVNQWTLIMDILIPTDGWHCFVQIDEPGNSNDGELFVNPANGIGISGSYQGSIVRGQWHRVVFAVDSLEVIAKYIDGVKAADQTTWSGKGLNGRHALLPTALLLSDEDGESQRCFLNSVQIRNYRMTDAGVAALGGPTPDGVPLVSGHWNFDDANAGYLATIGTDLLPRAGTEPLTFFEQTLMDDGQAFVMRYAYSGGTPNSSTLGYVLPHGILPNGGGQKVNQYSLIMDLFFPATSTGFRSLLEIQTNAPPTDGDLFVNGANGIGISGQYQGSVTPDEWHRVVFTFDLTKRELGKYIDGRNVLTGPVGSAPLGTGPYQYLSASSGIVDGRWALDPLALLFADEDGELAPGSVNSVQVRAEVLTPSQIALLGRASSTGIPANIPAQPPLSIVIGPFGSPTISWPATFTDYILERSTSLAPNAAWTEVSGAAADFYEEFEVANPAFFYRMRKVR
jgi:hypothetical protein